MINTKRPTILTDEYMKGAPFGEQVEEVLALSRTRTYDYRVDKAKQSAYLTGKEKIPKDDACIGIYRTIADDRSLSYEILDAIAGPMGNRSRYWVPVELGTSNWRAAPVPIDLTKHKDTFPLLHHELINEKTTCCFLTTFPDLTEDNNFFYLKQDGHVWLGVFPVNENIDHHDFTCLKNQENVIFMLEQSPNDQEFLKSLQMAENILSKLEEAGVEEPLCVDTEKSEIYNLKELKIEKKFIEELLKNE